MPAFIKGLELSGLFFEEAVRPVLSSEFPGLRYAAALLGTGSEVLGFDDEMSADHGWGPRVDLFVGADDYERANADVLETLRHRLPHRFRGYSTSFSEPDPTDNGVRRMAERDEGPVNHKINVFSPRGFFNYYLAFDIRDEIEPADWLTFPEQKLRTIAS